MLKLLLLLLVQLPNCPATHHIQQVDVTANPSVVIAEYDACVCLATGAVADNQVSCQQPTPTPTPVVTVTFDSPAVAIGPLNGVYQGIDFGAGQWACEGAWLQFTSRNCFFSSSVGTSRTFTFVNLKTLLSLQVVADVSGTLTLTDDLGQSVTRTVSVGSVIAVATGWTKPSRTVKVNYTGGWGAAFDNLTYQ